MMLVSAAQTPPTASAAIDMAERWLDPAEQPFGIVGENEAVAALCGLDSLGSGLSPRETAKAANIRRRAMEIIEIARFEHLEASIAELGWPLSAVDEEVGS